MSNYYNILITLSSVLTTVWGWRYGLRIRHRPFDAHKTWQSVVIGVGGTLAFFVLPVTFLLAMQSGLSRNRSVLLSMVAPIGFVLTGTWQIYYQLDKAEADIDRSNHHIKRYGNG